MNNRDAEVMGQTGIPNMQIMYYAILIAALGVVILVAGAYGLIPNTVVERFDNLDQGIKVVLSRLPLAGD